MNKTRFITTLVATAYFLYYCLTYTDWHFIDNVNLIIHEAGHIIFLPFGEFLHILGGSLWQVLLPLMFSFYFYQRREYFSASLVLFWVGQNLINVSVYASDSIAMQLPLLGGDSTTHDWNALLQMTGLLRYTSVIGSAIFSAGIFVIFCAICFSFYYSFSKEELIIK
ncbi:MAG: hypothetical protein KGL67_03190 [Patescibacteria group bacterium]|nr:hypothetical protein [Patescibacteria group bacterium]